MQSLWTSWTGLKAALNWLDTTGNNVANQETPGYAEQQASFADTLTAAIQPNATAPQVAGRYTLPGWNGGTGVQTTGLENDFGTEMSQENTGNATDLAIQGTGFFVVREPDGSREYTKAGDFIWSRQSNGSEVLSTPEGNPVLDVNGNPVVKKGSSGAAMTVSSNGTVSFNGRASQTIALAEISNPSQTLNLTGANAYQAQAGANIRIVNRAGAAATSSTVVQGALSMSNVNLTTEMSNMLEAQRMFDLNTEALNLTNQMMQGASNLKS